MANSNRMIHRHSPKTALDSHDTPAHATHRLLQAGRQDGWLWEARTHSVLEPAAGRGYMVRELKKTFDVVRASDIHDYKQGYRVADFTDKRTRFKSADWVITNPPYKHKEIFLDRALELATFGVAMFLQTGFVSGQARYQYIFKDRAPQYMYQFPDRVGSVKSPGGYLLHAWFVWLAPYSGDETTLRWLPLQ